MSTSRALADGETRPGRRGPSLDDPDTGSLRGDLVAFLPATHAALRHPLAARVIPAIAAEATRNDGLADLLRETVETPRRANAEHLLRRAIERAELPADCDLELGLD